MGEIDSRSTATEDLDEPRREGCISRGADETIARTREVAWEHQITIPRWAWDRHEARRCGDELCDVPYVAQPCSRGASCPTYLRGNCSQVIPARVCCRVPIFCRWGAVAEESPPWDSSGVGSKIRKQKTGSIKNFKY